VHVFVIEESAAAETRVLELRRMGYTVDIARTGSEALLTHQLADLVLVDLELQDIDGLEVCRAIRAAGDTPIITLTNRDSELDRVLALQAGSDDCVGKSIGLREFIARIEAVLRRSLPKPAVSQAIDLSPLYIDTASRTVYLDGKALDITTKEYELLLMLAGRPDSVVTRKELMAKVWETDWPASSRTIDTHVRSLRRKLRSNEWIETVRGVGYRMGRLRSDLVVSSAR
jgi:DNA-binding response OmpR family regulator